MSNPYLEAQREWDERFAFHARQAKIATMSAVGLLILCLALTGAIVWQAMYRSYIPYVVMVDDLGRPALANPAQVLTDWPEAVVLREVSEAVERLRSVPSDEAVLNKAWSKLFLYARRGTAGYQKMAERAQSSMVSPFVLQKTQTVEVEVRSVLFHGGRTWLAEWSELVRERATGQIIETKRYQGSFQLAQLGDLSPEVLTINPLGILIEDFDIRLLGGE
jgi:type IV secretory pathway TrbF-like protein